MSTLKQNIIAFFTQTRAQTGDIAFQQGYQDGRFSAEPRSANFDHDMWLQTCYMNGYKLQSAERELAATKARLTEADLKLSSALESLSMLHTGGPVALEEAPVCEANPDDMVTMTIIVKRDGKVSMEQDMAEGVDYSVGQIIALGALASATSMINEGNTDV